LSAAIGVCRGARLTQTRVPAPRHHPRVVPSPAASPVSMTRRTHGMHRTVRAFMHLISQETARANAAEASAKLRKRRHEREEVDAYLTDLHSPIAATPDD
jgi:hypothetical protein